VEGKLLCRWGVERALRRAWDDSGAECAALGDGSILEWVEVVELMSIVSHMDILFISAYSLVLVREQGRVKVPCV